MYPALRRVEAAGHIAGEAFPRIAIGEMPAIGLDQDQLIAAVGAAGRSAGIAYPRYYMPTIGQEAAGLHGEIMGRYAAGAA